MTEVGVATVNDTIAERSDKFVIASEEGLLRRVISNSSARLAGES